MATTLLKKETNIPPLQLYIKVTAMQRTQKKYNSNITKYIKTCLNNYRGTLRRFAEKQINNPKIRKTFW